VLEDTGERRPDLVAHLSGLSAGEETVFTHTFPDDFQLERYAGMTVEYTVRVEAVKEREEMDLDDEFAALVGDYDSLEDLKAQIRQVLTEQKRAEVDDQLASQMVEVLLEQTCTVRWPAVLEEEVLDDLVEEHQYALERMGLDFETHLKTRQMTEEEFREELRPEAQKKLRRSLLLDEIAEREQIEVSAQETLDYIRSLIASVGDPDLEEVLAREEGANLIAQAHVYLRRQKALERLALIARGEAELEAEAETGTGATPAEETADSPGTPESETNPNSL